MIQKSLDSISIDDIQALIDNQVREDKTTEYKRELPGGKSSEKVPFLEGICAFANTDGGDLLIGLEEEDGVPVKIAQLPIQDVDREVLRLDQMIRAGLEPPVQRLTVKPIKVQGNEHVFLIRVEKSWNAPHRVRDNLKFYGRNSAGKYSLDVSELRVAFTLSEQIAERIRSFRVGRIISINGNDTPVPLAVGAKIILHLVPISAFTTRTVLDVLKYRNNDRSLKPMGGPGYNMRLNFEGLLVFSPSTRQLSNQAYVQLYRSGIIESVLVFEPDPNKREISGLYYETKTIGAVRRQLDLLSKAQMGLPIFMFLSLTDIKGYSFFAQSFEEPVIDRDSVLLPELLIESYDIEIGKELHPLFDMVCNAFNVEHSYNYDQNGNHIKVLPE